MSMYRDTESGYRFRYIRRFLDKQKSREFVAAL
jgi:hypothetical protein